MSRNGPGGSGRRRKFKVRMPDDGGAAPDEARPKARALAPDDADDEERAENYLAEEAQRPFVPEVFLIKKRP